MTILEIKNSSLIMNNKLTKTSSLFAKFSIQKSKDCSYLFGSTNGNLTVADVNKINALRLYFDREYLVDIGFCYKSHNSCTPYHETKGTIVKNLSLINSTIIGINVQQINNIYIKRIQFQLRDSTSNISYWTPIFGKITSNNEKLLKTFSFNNINYINSLAIYSNIYNSSDRFLAGFLIKFNSENCFPLKVTKSLTVNETNRSLLKKKEAEEEVSASTSVSCSLMFGSNSGFLTKTMIDQIDTIQVFSSDNYVNKINFFYNNDGSNFILFPITNLTGISVTNISFVNTSVVGIYIQSKDNYIKCFRFKLKNLTTNNTYWTPLIGKMERNKSASVQTFISDQYTSIYQIKTYNKIDTSDQILTGLQIIFNSDTCLPLTTSLNAIKVTTTIFMNLIIPNSTLPENKSTAMPIIVVIFSISIPLLFVSISGLLCYLNYR